MPRAFNIDTLPEVSAARAFPINATVFAVPNRSKPRAKRSEKVPGGRVGGQPLGIQKVKLMKRKGSASKAYFSGVFLVPFWCLWRVKKGFETGSNPCRSASC